MSNGRLKGLGIIRPEEDIVEDVLMGEICSRCPCGSVWPHYLNVFAERTFIVSPLRADTACFSGGYRLEGGANSKSLKYT